MLFGMLYCKGMSMNRAILLVCAVLYFPWMLARCFSAGRPLTLYILRVILFVSTTPSPQPPFLTPNRPAQARVRVSACWCSTRVYNTSAHHRVLCPLHKCLLMLSSYFACAAFSFCYWFRLPADLSTVDIHFVHPLYRQLVALTHPSLLLRHPNPSGACSHTHPFVFGCSIRKMAEFA